MLDVVCIDDEHAFAELGSVWNDLLRRSETDCFFQTWEWISTWWEIYGRSYQPHILVARDRADRLCGIAPLMTGPGPGKIGRHFRYLMFLGQNEDATPEYLDFIIESGREDEVTTAFCDYLATTRKGAWDLLLLEHMLTSSPNLNALLRGFGGHGVEIGIRSQVACPYTALPDSWTAFLQSRSKHFRKRVKYRARQLAKEGEVRYCFVDRDIPLDQAFAHLVRLNRSRWGEEGESFCSASYTEFHRRLCHLLLERGWLILVLMSVDDTVVATEYNYGYAGKIWGNQGGWLLDWADKGVASVLTAQIMQWGIEQGYQEYDFMGGESEYKYKWATAERQMVDLEAINSSLRGQIYRYARLAKRFLERTKGHFGRGRALSNEGANVNDG